MVWWNVQFCCVILQSFEKEILIYFCKTPKFRFKQKVSLELPSIITLKALLRTCYRPRKQDRWSSWMWQSQMRRDYWDKRKWHIFAILLPGHEVLLKCKPSKTQDSELNNETVLIFNWNSVDFNFYVEMAKTINVFKSHIFCFICSVYISERPNRSWDE